MSASRPSGPSGRGRGAPLGFLTLVVVALVFISAAGHGEPYPKFADAYQGPHGSFSYSSEVSDVDPSTITEPYMTVAGGKTLVYSVCNEDAKGALAFSWDAPPLGTGTTHPLASAGCARLTRTATAITVTETSSIAFSGTDERRNVKAYVAADTPQLSHSWVSHLSGLFAWAATETRSLDVVVRIDVSDGKHIDHFIRWPQGWSPDAVFAFGFSRDNLPEATRSNLNHNMPGMHTAALGDFVAAADRDRLPPAAGQMIYLVIEPRAGLLGFEFRYDAAKVDPALQPIIITDQQMRLIAAGAYATIH